MAAPLVAALLIQIVAIAKKVMGAGSVVGGTVILMGAFTAAALSITSYRLLVTELVKLLPMRLNLIMTYFGFFVAVETLFAMIATAYGIRYTRFLLSRSAKLIEKASS